MTALEEVADKLVHLNRMGERIIELAVDGLTPSESAMLLGSVIGCMAKVASDTEQFLGVVDKVARDIISSEGLTKDAD